MTASERIEYLKRQTTDIPGLTDDVIGDKLNEAVNAVLVQRYPFGIPDDVDEVPKQYESIALRLAIRYINRIGTEGETDHHENGIIRIYKNTEDEDLLAKVVPCVKVL